MDITGNGTAFSLGFCIINIQDSYIGFIDKHKNCCSGFKHFLLQTKPYNLYSGIVLKHSVLKTEGLKLLNLVYLKASKLSTFSIEN